MSKKMLLLAIGMLLSVTGSALAIDHWWHGGVSANVNDPANWTDRNVSTNPTTPTGSPYDIVRIGASWDTEDLNGNGTLDPGEDLNGNGVIDDPNPNFGVGYGGYYGAGGGIELAVNPVLSDTYVSRTGTSQGGWWFVVNAPNILTLKDGAYLVMSRENCNLRNGGRLEVQGRSNTGGPSLVVARRFRVAENGSIAEAAHETSQVRINGMGWMQMDPELSNTGEAFMIGTPDAPGTMPRGEIIIEDQGRLEVLTGDPAPYLDFGNANPSVNQIIIRDNGELWLPGDPGTMGRVGAGNTTISLADMIATGLIANDQGGTLVVSGFNPTVITVSGVDNPNPTYANPDVPRDVVLGWDPDAATPGATYDVYLGTDLASVTNATRGNSMGVLKKQGQTETSYPLTGALSLEFGRTYYWRVDTVTGSTTSRGKLWYFTVEAFAQPIAPQAISATASSSVEGQGPEKTIDRSGLDADGLHSDVLEDMWLSDASEPNAAWIQYEFDKPYKLHQMLVWNYNGMLFLAGYGLHDVTIAYSADGATWSRMGAVFTGAPGLPGYAANTTVECGGVVAKMVRITARNNWGDNPLFNQYGLSEVQFLHIPVSAREPVPVSGSTDVAPDATLKWRPGRQAVEHKVYLSTDEQAVIAGTAPAVTVAQTSYSPAMNLSTTYYWRVDEVNAAAAPAVWPGSVWSFTTAPVMVVDDFESYTNDSPNRVFQTWIDGLGFSSDAFFPNGNNGNGTGAIIGHDPAAGNIMERTIVHGGRQSMPVSYEGLSEAIRTFAPAQNWSQHGVQTLVIHFRGTAGNTGQLYAKIGNAKVAYPGAGSDVAAEVWTSWEIPLASSGASLANVSSLTIGIDGGGAKGLLYIDDVLLK